MFKTYFNMYCNIFNIKDFLNNDLFSYFTDCRMDFYDAKKLRRKNLEVRHVQYKLGYTALLL